jgi:hypothetical protein
VRSRWQQLALALQGSRHHELYLPDCNQAACEATEQQWFIMQCVLSICCCVVSVQGGICPDGDACNYTHNVYEDWLHPLKYVQMRMRCSSLSE